MATHQVVAGLSRSRTTLFSDTSGSPVVPEPDTLVKTGVLAAVFWHRKRCGLLWPEPEKPMRISLGLVGLTLNDVNV